MRIVIASEAIAAPISSRFLIWSCTVIARKDPTFLIKYQKRRSPFAMTIMIFPLP